jgi:AcrR family transcriptional regulator
MNDEATNYRQRDRERTSGTILKIATELFFERGYAAVPISLIAKQASVTKSLIYHYFGDKQGLWLAVKDAAVATYAEQQRAVFSSTETGHSEVAVADSAAAYFSFIQKHPEIARMFALECFEGEFEPGATERELQTNGIAFIEGLQSKGVLRKDIQADMMLAVFSSLIEHWFISRERVARLNSKSPGPSLDARYFDAVMKILAGVLPPS